MLPDRKKFLRPGELVRTARCDGWCRQGAAHRRVRAPSPSRRPLQLAAGSFCRPRGLVAGHRTAHGEHGVRVALRRMPLADVDCAHELAVTVPVFPAAGLDTDLARQLEA